MLFQENLQKLRRQKGWTQQQLADVTGIPLRTLIGYENSPDHLPGGENMAALEEAFGVTGAQLLGDSFTPRGVSQPAEADPPGPVPLQGFPAKRRENSRRLIGELNPSLRAKEMDHLLHLLWDLQAILQEPKPAVRETMLQGLAAVVSRYRSQAEDIQGELEGRLEEYAREQAIDLEPQGYDLSRDPLIDAGLLEEYLQASISDQPAEIPFKIPVAALEPELLQAALSPLLEQIAKQHMGELLKNLNREKELVISDFIHHMAMALIYPAYPLEELTGGSSKKEKGRRKKQGSAAKGPVRPSSGSRPAQSGPSGKRNSKKSY